MVVSDNNKHVKLRNLQQKFASTLPERLNLIQTAWLNSQGTPDNTELFTDLLRQVHSLAGSAGTFNFFRLGDVAKELELLLKDYQHGSLTEAVTTTVSKLLQQLVALAEQGHEQPKTELITDDSAEIEHLSNQQAVIYVLEDDEDIAAESFRQLIHFGYQVVTFNSVSDFKHAIYQQIPDALLIDIQLVEGEFAGTEAVADVCKTLQLNIPSIFISQHQSWQHRLSAMRVGGQGYITKPIDFDQLADQLEILTGRKQGSRYRILIVDDTVLLAEHYATILQCAGMDTEIINDPGHLLDVLPNFRPDLILMDLYMNGSTGIEAAQVIRQHGSYTNLPIVYLSTESELEQQLNALRAGGDDFLQKPIDDNHLVAAVSTKAKRFRELNSLMNCDGLTGLLNHISFKLALEREIAQTYRYHEGFTLAMLDIDYFKLVNDHYGHLVGDRVIKGLGRLLSHRLRKGDIAARYGGEEFALILPNTPESVAKRLLDELREVFAKIAFAHAHGTFHATFSVGIASCPPYKNVHSLIEAADQALYQAKRTGRNQVHIAAGNR